MMIAWSAAAHVAAVQQPQPQPQQRRRQRRHVHRLLAALVVLTAAHRVAVGGLNYGSLPPPATLALLGGSLLAANATATIGAAHTCVVGAGGQVQCAGYDGNGQIDVPAHANAAWVCAGMRHSCAVVNAVGGVGTTLCWGQASSAIGAVAGVAQVTCGAAHSCALFGSNGSVVCGGDCGAGQCAVPAAWGGIAMTSAGTEHTLVLFYNGSVACVGSNAHGQCAVPPPSDLPVSVSWVSAGAATSCVANATGAVTCWGNLYLQPTPSPSLSPSVRALWYLAYNTPSRSRTTACCRAPRHARTPQGQASRRVQVMPASLSDNCSAPRPSVLAHSGAPPAAAHCKHRRCLPPSRNSTRSHTASATPMAILSSRALPSR